MATRESLIAEGYSILSTQEAADVLATDPQGATIRVYASWHGQFVSVKSTYHLEKYIDRDFFYSSSVPEAIRRMIRKAD